MGEKPAGNVDLAERMRRQNKENNGSTSNGRRTTKERKNTVTVTEFLELKERLGTSTETVNSLKKAVEELTTKLKAAETENEKLKAQLDDTAQFLEQQSKDCVIAPYILTCAALPYADLLRKWLSALQDLMGLARALDEFPEAKLREFWAERYLQGVKWLRLDPPAAEDDRTTRLLADWEETRKGGLPDMLRWWTKVRRNIEKNAEVLRERELVERLRPMLAELRTMSPADCLRPEGLALLRRAAETAGTGLREIGFFPEFYGSQRTREQMAGDPEVADAFNEGDSACVEVPALFLERDGRWEMLSGRMGMTRLKTER